MFVKRFIAKDMQEAMRRINREFGPDAVILENKKVRQKGIAGLFKKKVFEVVAAYEPNRPKKETSKEPPPEAPKEDVSKAPQDPIEEVMAPPQAPQEVSSSTTVYMSESQPQGEEPMEDTHTQLGIQMQELRDVVQEFTNRISIVGGEKSSTYSSDVQHIYKGLLECDVHEDICKEIASQAESIKSRRDIDARTVTQQLILDRLGDPMPLKLKKFDQNVLLFMGPTGAGKTTTLGALAGAIPARERVVTCEEVFELTLPVRDVVALQCRQPSLEGTGEITLRRLVKEALRMRPDRIVVGEVREAEALDLLIALNAGLPGMCTVHANSARDALAKMCTLPLLAGDNVSDRFVVPAVASAIDLVVHVDLEPGGARRVREVAGVSGRVEGGVIEMSDIFTRRDGALIRGGGFPPHPERFAGRGLPLRDLLAA